MATKFDMVIAHAKGSQTAKARDPLIMWSLNVLCYGKLGEARVWGSHSI